LFRGLRKKITELQIFFVVGDFDRKKRLLPLARKVLGCPARQAFENVDLLTFAINGHRLKNMKRQGILTFVNFFIFAFVAVAALATALLTAPSAQAADPSWQKISSHLKNSRQLLWVEPASLFQSRMKLYEKQNGRWALVTLPGMPSEFPVVIGLLGFASPAQKREGDKKTPKGIYSFGDFFGKADAAYSHWKYKTVTVADKWIDDPTHPDYNKWIGGETTAKSYENLWREDGLYDPAAVIDYNRSPIVPGRGSAIFMHVWRGPIFGTAGCVAMKKENLEKVLHWMDEKKNPQILLSDVD
jgi:L,D-peptidoglycan transpeptidase YkuD (ErfK/YbiS/YcfS/YnhG family)